jgi:2-C-methyl-D-erythritol 4-phosphate cytidylyltransferase
MQYSVVILAAGSGERSGLEYNKVFHEIRGKMVLEFSLEFFESQPLCQQIILVCSRSDFNFMHDRFHGRVNAIVLGGETRQQSVWNGLNKVINDVVLIHDAARPYLNPSNIEALLHDVLSTKASTLAIPVPDTIVKTSGNRLTKTLNRSELVIVQTPQAFDRAVLMRAHEAARKANYLATDDTELVRRFTSVMPSFVMGDPRTMKLTRKADISVLEGLL